MKADRTIFKRRKRTQFTQIANKPLQEKGLSLEAVGLLACVMSMPENFAFGRDWARWRFDIGREKLDRIIKELRDYGYVRFEQERDKHQRLGKSIYMFTDEAGQFEDEEPLPAKPSYGFSVAGKPFRKAGNGSVLYKDKNKKRGADAPDLDISPREAEPAAPPNETPSPEVRAERLRQMRELVNSIKSTNDISRKRL